MLESDRLKQETDPTERLRLHIQDAERKAWDSLGKYKFQMFGYWASIWVHLNQVGNFKQPNPWTWLVKTARAELLSIEANEEPKTGQEK